MTRETRRRYPLGAHMVKPSLLCNNIIIIIILYVGLKLPINPL